MLHALEFVEHMLATLLLQVYLCANLWLVDVGKSRSLHFVFLVMNHICQVLLLASLLVLKLLSLIDRAEPLIAFVELGKNIRFVV